MNDRKFHLIDSLVKSHIKKQAKQIVELQQRVTLLEAELAVVKIYSEDILRITGRK